MCYQYWPQTGLIQFVGYTVDLMEEKVMEGFIMRKISVYNQKVISGQILIATHFSVMMLKLSKSSSIVCRKCRPMESIFVIAVNTICTAI